MKCILVRNVKFSAAECNSFNMRKKNLGDLASKKTSGGSSVKKQPSGCKVASIGVQSYNHQNAIPNFFDFNWKYILSINGGFLIGNIYASHQIALRSSPNSSPLKTAYLYSLSVYLCSFRHFLPPLFVKILP